MIRNFFPHSFTLARRNFRLPGSSLPLSINLDYAAAPHFPPLIMETKNRNQFFASDTVLKLTELEGIADEGKFIAKSGCLWGRRGRNWGLEHSVGSKIFQSTICFLFKLKLSTNFRFRMWSIDLNNRNKSLSVHASMRTRTNSSSAAAAPPRQTHNVSRIRIPQSTRN